MHMLQHDVKRTQLLLLLLPPLLLLLLLLQLHGLRGRAALRCAH
jgi:hypothetical protein